MKWNLRNRILLPTLILIASITVAISAVSFLKSRTALAKTLDAQLEHLSVSGVAQVEAWVDEQRKNLLQWAIETNVRTALQDTPNAQKARTTVDEELVHAKSVYGFYEDVHLTGPDGMTVASSNPSSVGKLNVSDRQYFKDAIAGKTVISDVLQSRTTGNPIVVVATPIKDGETVRGVLFGVLDLNWFSSKFISNIKVLETGYAFLFDQKGTFIAHPDKNQILKTKLGDFEWGAGLLGKGHGYLQYTFQGASKKAVFHTSEILGWGMVLTVPMAELEAPARHMAILNLILGGVRWPSGYL